MKTLALVLIIASGWLASCDRTPQATTIHNQGPAENEPPDLNSSSPSLDTQPQPVVPSE